jgi:hypothetical protein
MRSSLLIADIGPQFDGWAGEVDGKMICVAPPGIEQDADRRRIMLEVVRRSGGNCGACRGCVLAVGE